MSFLALRFSVKLSSVGLCATTAAATKTNFLQVANITTPGPGEETKRQRERKPWDYRRKRFRMIHQIYDRTLARMDENSKVIVIDGPIASGKTEFARKLAQALDFKFVPQGDPAWIHDCGFKRFYNGVAGLNYKDLDDLLPPEHRVYDLEKFLTDKDPSLDGDGTARPGIMQHEFFACRMFTYNDALLHLLSTGQGVVCVRSPWSDRVFAKALLDNNYLSPAGFKWYRDYIAYQSSYDYPRPHLVIYLDASVEETKENIKRRNNELEVNTKVLTDSFLASIENDYKEVVLPATETHSELLVYPSIPEITQNEVNQMVEDIEALGPMAHSGISDDNFLGDWKYLRDEELADKRRTYQSLRQAVRCINRNKAWEAPECLDDNYFDHARHELYSTLPGYRYDMRFEPTVHPWWKIALGIPFIKPSKERRRFWIPA